MQSTAVLILAGVLVWSIAGIRVISNLVDFGFTTGVLRDFAAWLLFIASFAVHVWFDSGRRPRHRLFPLLLQAACGLVLTISAGGTGMEIALLVMVAGQLPGTVPMGRSLIWVAVQTGVVLAAQIVGGETFSLAGGVMFFGSYSAFQLFALGAASLAESEREAREALAAAKAEVERLHEVALEGARHAERLRIARDLHDSLGHRLTALGLTLEAARHVASGEVPRKIEEARGLATALMNDLRAAVGEIRDDELPELRTLLESLKHSVASPRVTVDLPPSLRITNAEAVSALFRIGQEIVTNAARHAAATEARLTLKVEGDEVILEGVDNGPTTGPFDEGNGLRGISERARLLGGEAAFSRDSAGGFRVVVRVPVSRLV